MILFEIPDDGMCCWRQSNECQKYVTEAYLSVNDVREMDFNAEFYYFVYLAFVYYAFVFSEEHNSAGNTDSLYFFGSVLHENSACLTPDLFAFAFTISYLSKPR